MRACFPFRYESVQRGGGSGWPEGAHFTMPASERAMERKKSGGSVVGDVTKLYHTAGGG